MISMFKRMFTFFLMIVLLVSCVPATQGEPPSYTPISSNTPTPTLTPSPTPTLTPSPTATNTPTPTATPFAGGGKILMVLLQEYYPNQVSLQGNFNLFVANLDGNEIQTITDFDFEEGWSAFFAGISPDYQSVAVIVGNRERGISYLFILDAASEQLIQVTNDDLALYHEEYGENPVLWLPDGRLAFVARDTDGRYTIFLVQPSGQGLSRLTKPLSTGYIPRSLIAASPDGAGLYWVSGNPCNDRGLCEEKYYWTKLDDSDQQQVWQAIQEGSYKIFISPAGKFLAYSPYFGTRDSRNGCYIAPINGIDISNVVQLKVNDQPVGCWYDYWSPGHNWSPDGKALLINTFETNTVVLYIWSSEDQSYTRLPDYGATSCSEYVWIDNSHLFLHDCILGDLFRVLYQDDLSLVTGPRLIDLSNMSVEEYPFLGDYGYTLYFSPDRTKVILRWGGSLTRRGHNLSSDFVMFDLTNGQVNPIFYSLYPFDFLWLNTP